MSNISNASNTSAANATAQLSFNFTELSTNVINTLTNIPSNISNLFTNAQVQIQESFKNQYTNSSIQHFVHSVQSNESLNSVREAVANNSMVLGETSSVIAGYIASDATIQLLRQDKGISTKREVVKLAVASGIIAASHMLSPSNDLDKATITVCALSGALLNAAWKGATSPVTHHFYVLKSGV